MHRRTVTRVDLIEAIRRESGLSRAKAIAMFELVLAEITECLERGEDVLLSSFGSFQVREKKARMGRNPKNGEVAIVSARRVMTFKPSATLKRKMNSKSSDEEAKWRAAALGNNEPMSERRYYFPKEGQNARTAPALGEF
jgi:integration host factor subunit alpha